MRNVNSVGTTSSAKRFEMLRTRVETALEPNSVLCVSSAYEGDGKRLTAYGLARSFRRAGYNVLLIDANEQSPFAHDESRGSVTLMQLADLGPKAFCRVSNDVPVVSFPVNIFPDRVSSRDVKAAVERCRAEFEYTVVNLPCLLDSSVALLFALSSNLLVSVREKRGVAPRDRELVELISREAVKLIGSVTVSAESILDSLHETASVDVAVNAVSESESSQRRHTVPG